MSGLTLEQQQLALFKQALEDILHPVAALQRQCPDAARLDGAYAVRLADDPAHLRQIAEQALRAAEDAAEARRRVTKVVFLDIDEVINTHAAWVAYGERRYFDPTAVGLIRRLLEETGARIVVSSVWRKGTDYLRMAELLSIGGLGTNCLYYQHPAPGQNELSMAQQAWRTDPGHDNPRGAKIKQWLEAYGKDITHYVILDDDRDMLPEQLDHFVHVDGQVGFNFRDYERARMALGCAADPSALHPFRGVGIGYDLPETDELGEVPGPTPATA